jgi:ribosomal protein L7/L12
MGSAFTHEHTLNVVISHINKFQIIIIKVVKSIKRISLWEIKESTKGP